MPRVRKEQKTDRVEGKVGAESATGLTVRISLFFIFKANVDLKSLTRATGCVD